MTTAKKKPKSRALCCETTSGPGALHTFPCTNPAKVIRDGKPYCGRHDPLKVKAQREKRNAEWNARRDAEKAARAKAEAERAERERRADCFDDLLTSAADLVQKIDYLIDQSEGITGLCLSGDFTPWSDARYGGPLGSGMQALENLRAAVAKARGES